MQAVSVLVVVLVSACWTGSTTPPPAAPSDPPASQPRARHVPPSRETSSIEQTFVEMERFSERMCNCSDTACAQQVADDMTSWSREYSEQNPGSPPTLTEEQTKRFADLGMRMGECMQRAMTSPPPTTPPPPPTTPPPPSSP